jgi:hypothetical protein
MGRTAVNTIVERSLLILACLGLLTGTASAESGIRIKSGPSVFAGPANPPCDGTSTITFRTEIENTNCVCNEDVNPIKRADFLIDFAGDKLNPFFGSFEFLGFKKTAGGTLSPTLDFIDMEDETSTDFFFDVRVHPDAGGCPFVSAEFGIVICDGGGGCDWGASTDLPYPVCESPKLVPVVHIDADATNCAPSGVGTGEIHGTVTDGVTGLPVALAWIEVSKGCFLAPGFVGKSTLSSFGWPTEIGTYKVPTNFPSEPGLPAGTYKLKVQEGGRCSSQMVTLADGESKLVNVTLGAAPAPCP